MSYTCTTPTGLTGTLSGDNVNLSWVASTIIGSGPVLLLHFDGTTNDSSGNGYNFTLNAGASVVSSPVAFGTGALENSNAGTQSLTYRAYGASDLLNLAAVPSWTIEGWVNLRTTAQIFATSNDNTGSGSFDSGVDFGFSVASNQYSATIWGSGGSLLAGMTLNNSTYNTFQHFAIVKYPYPGGGDQYQLFVNGVGSGSSGRVTGASSPWTGYWCFGGFYDNTTAAFIGGAFTQGANSYVDEFCVTSGTAKYTANFTPPTSPFSAAGSPAPGYDIYRNGVSIGTFVGTTPVYTDTVPGNGTYTYNVAAWYGGSDLSAQSNPFTITLGGQAVFKAIMVANPGAINPRIYPPQVDSTVRVTPPRIIP